MEDFFCWNDDYDLGVKDMNDDHKVLIDLMNQLYEAHEQGEKFEVIRERFLELENFTKTHFKDEEKFMEKVEFPDIEAHKLIHIDLLEKLSKHKEEFLASGSLGPTVFNFLKLWLSAHIRGIDMKYADFHQSQKAG